MMQADHVTDRPTLHTERLVLRPFTQDGAPRVAELAGAWEIADTSAVVPHRYALDEAVTWIASHASQWEQGGAAQLAITDKASGDLYGAITLGIDRGNDRGSLGYWVGVPYWNNGYYTEAAHTVLDGLPHAFTELGLHRVFAHHLVRNPASGRVMQKIGMTFEGVHRHAIKKWDKYEDIAAYAILVDEWRNERE